MKKNLCGAVMVLLGLSLSSAVLAYPPQPVFCPGVASIKAYGVSRNAFEVREGIWTTGRRHSNYDTPDPWSFVIENIPATTSNDAYLKAVAGLTTLQLQAGPITGPFSTWVCLYNTIEGYSAGTINPPISLTNGAQYLR